MRMRHCDKYCFLFLFLDSSVLMVMVLNADGCLIRDDFTWNNVRITENPFGHLQDRYTYIYTLPNSPESSKIAECSVYVTTVGLFIHFNTTTTFLTLDFRSDIDCK